MVELVAEGGYNAVTVGGLARRAAVSKRDFYRRFDGKEECFLATYDEIVRSSLRGILAASAGEAEWCGRLRTGFLAFANQIADSPEAACLALVEVFAAGPVAVERMERTNQLFEALVAKNFALADGGAQLPPLVIKGVVAGGARVARARLLAGNPRQLTLDGQELMDWALCFCDDAVGRLRGAGSALSYELNEPDAEPAPLDDERTMILSAVAKLAAREGYYELTVPRIRAAAGVSRRSFNTHFEGVTDCFLASIDLRWERALARALDVYRHAGDWATGVDRALAALCAQLAADPVLAKLAFVEIFCPAPEAVRWRAELLAKLARLLRSGADPAREPGELAAEASVGAIWGVVHHHVATGQTSRLPQATPTLSYLALAPAVGAAAAVEAIGIGPEGDRGRGRTGASGARSA